MSPKKKLIIVLALFPLYIFAQNSTNGTCENEPTDDLLDFNSITKCTIEEHDSKSKTKKISFQVSSRNRLKRKRSKASTLINNEHDHKISEIKKNTSIVNSLSLKNVEKSGAISFFKTDDIPLFEKCRSASISTQKACFKKQINRHIKINFEYPKNSYLKGIQGRVLVNFIIDKEGKVNITNTLSPYQGDELKEEAERIVKKLPTFIPGKHSGTKVDVQYSLRLMFGIPGVEKTNVRKKVEKETSLGEVYDFGNVDEIPNFKQCSKNKVNASNCFISELQQYVTNNFHYPIQATMTGTEGVVNLNFVINNKGEVINIEANGPENAEILESAAKRLIEKLPLLIPAVKNNTPVNTRFSFPIVFSLN